MGGGVALSDVATAIGQDFSQNYQGSFTFPNDLVTSAASDIYMTFRFAKFVKRSIYDTASVQTGNGKIILPIPRNLHNSLGLTYSSDEFLGPAVGAAVDSIARGKSSANTSSLSTIIASVTGAYAGGAATQAAVSAVTNAGQGVGTAAQLLSGLSINPFQTMLFKHPNFKTHRFSWMLAPSSPKESDDLAAIIDIFTYHSLPGLTDQITGVFFNAPSIVVINLSPPGNKYLFDYKTCVITGINVDYSPGPTPAFFDTANAPVLVQLSLDLTEIELWTKRDYLQPSNISTNTPSAPLTPNVSSVPALDPAHPPPS